MLFGALPVLVASRRKLPRPPRRWDIWLTLNVGLIVLLAGIPSVNQPLIFTGGTLILSPPRCLSANCGACAAQMAPRWAKV